MRDFYLPINYMEIQPRHISNATADLLLFPPTQFNHYLLDVCVWLLDVRDSSPRNHQTKTHLDRNIYDSSIATYFRTSSQNEQFTHYKTLCYIFNQTNKHALIFEQTNPVIVNSESR